MERRSLTRSRLSKVVLLGVTAAVALQGCTAFNPHIRPEMPALDKNTEDGDLPAAIGRAQKLRAAYLDAVGDQAKLRNGLALTLVPLSAFAVFYGITSSDRGTKDFITATGVAGASLLGLSTFISNDGRRDIYLAGASAVSCAVFAMRPYLLNDKETLDEEVKTLGAAIRRAQTLTGSDADLAKVPLAAATKTYDAGQRYTAEVNAAGSRLDLTIQDIATEVSKQISKTEPSIQSIAAITSSLNTMGAGFIPGFSAAKSPAAGPVGGGAAKGGDKAQALVGTSQQVIDELIAANDALADRLDRAQALVKTVKSIDECKPADAVPAIRLVPEVDRITLAPSESYQLTVLGGSGVPQAAITGADPAGVTVKPELANGAYVLKVVAAAGATAGDRTLVVSDGTPRAARTVTVQVAAASGGDGGGGVAAAAAAEGAATDKSVVRAVQEALGMDENKQDGIVGPTTRTAISAFKHGKEWDDKSGTITPDLLEALNISQ